MPSCTIQKQKNFYLTLVLLTPSNLAVYSQTNMTPLSNEKIVSKKSGHGAKISETIGF